MLKSKTCSKCKTEKPIDRFSISKRNKCGYNSHCKECVRIGIVAWTDKIIARNRAGREIPDYKCCYICKETKHKSEFGRNIRSPDGMPSYCRVCYQIQDVRRISRIRAPEVRRQQFAADPVMFKAVQMVRNAKHRAKVQKVPFSITVQYIKNICTGFCPVLGIPIDYVSTKISDGSPALDKFDPSAGYVEGNVNVISHRANTLKGNATPEELMKIALWAQRTAATMSQQNDNDNEDFSCSVGMLSVLT